MRTHHEDTANEVYGEYRWRTTRPDDLSVTDGTAEEAAEAMGLDVTEIEWAVDEFGRCDTKFQHEDTLEGIVCWKPGEPEGPADEGYIQGGWEWPIAEAPAEGD